MDSPASFLSVGLALPTMSEARTPHAQWTAAPKIPMLVSRLGPGRYANLARQGALAEGKHDVPKDSSRSVHVRSVRNVIATQQRPSAA